MDPLSSTYNNFSRTESQIEFQQKTTRRCCFCKCFDFLLRRRCFQRAPQKSSSLPIATCNLSKMQEHSTLPTHSLSTQTSGLPSTVFLSKKEIQILISNFERSLEGRIKTVGRDCEVVDMYKRSKAKSQTTEELLEQYTTNVRNVAIQLLTKLSENPTVKKNFETMHVKIQEIFQSAIAKFKEELQKLEQLS